MPAAALLLSLCSCGSFEDILGLAGEESGGTYSRGETVSEPDDESSAEIPFTDGGLFTTEAVSGGVAVTGYTGTESVVKIPQTIGGSTVVSVAEGGVSDVVTGDGEVTVTDVIVPDTVTSIARGAFSGCKRIQRLSVPFAGGSEGEHTYIGYVFGAGSPEQNINFLPESLEELTVGGSTVHERAFLGCERLKSITFTEAVTVESSAFDGCSGLRTLVLPQSARNLGADLFKGCSSLTELTLPYLGNGADKLFLGALFGAEDYTQNLDFVPSSLRTVTVPCPEALPEGAFYECKNITEVNLLGGPETVGEKCFYRCRRLKEINITDDGYKGIESLGAYAFGYCAAIGEIRLAPDVKPIPDGAFYACSSLRTLYVGEEENTLPASHTSIGKEAFAYCENLTSLVLPQGISEIGSKLFYGCSYLAEISVPASVRSIGEDAFMGCSSLSLFTVETSGGNGLRDIGSGAFSYCTSLTSVVLPDCVRSVGDRAFAFSGVADVAIKGADVTLGSGVFDGCGDFTVDVDRSSKTYDNLVKAGLGSGNFKR